MSNHIILHCVPPASITLPSPALSILKTSLVNAGDDVSIIYWNIILQDLTNSFIFSKNSDICRTFWYLPYVNYIAIEENNTILISKIAQILRSINPSLINEDDIINHLLNHHDRFHEIVISTLSSYKVDNSILSGFTLKLDQWFIASIIASIIKKFHPNHPIIGGGIGTKEGAIELLRNYSCFDYALWGEGETNLVALASNILTGNPPLENIPNIAYYHNSNIITSSCKQLFQNLSESSFIPDYSDYFSQIKHIQQEINIFIPVEHSRGCHWNRCHFCYLNTGYKFRYKIPEKLHQELISLIEKHHIYQFAFLDNDLIGNNLEHFNEILDVFIDIKKKYPLFTIGSAEIITKDLTYSLIKKMSMAGIIKVQIGYECTSDSLLNKIDKKNTFSSNLLFIKFASKFNIGITTLNVIINLLEETTPDIIESITNLKFLRFYRNSNDINHRLVPLSINGMSRYCLNHNTQLDRIQWSPYSDLYDLIKEYLNESFAWLYFEHCKNFKDSHWVCFERFEYVYSKIKSTYALIQKDDYIYFTEYSNNIEISKLVFHVESVEYQILVICNREIQSLNHISKILKNIDCKILKEKIVMLHNKGIIYANSSFTEILTIIDMDTLIS